MQADTNVSLTGWRSDDGTTRFIRLIRHLGTALQLGSAERGGEGEEGGGPITVSYEQI